MYSSIGSERGSKQDVGREEREAGRCIYAPRSSYDWESAGGARSSVSVCFVRSSAY